MRTLRSARIAVAVTGLVLAGTAFAAPGNNTRVRHEAEFEPGVGSLEPEAEGDSRHEKKTHKGAVQLHRFRAEVKIPIPSTGLGIENGADAQTAEVLLVLSNAGGPYAQCTLELHHLRAGKAVYKVDVRLIPRSGGPVLREQKGSCVLDALGTTPGVPDVVEDDTAVVTANGGPFLEGVFVED